MVKVKKAKSPTGKPSKESAAIKAFDRGEKVAGKRPKKAPEKSKAAPSKKRKVDSLAGQRSFLSGLKARREAVESGDVENASKAYLDALKVKASKRIKPLRK